MSLEVGAGIKRQAEEGFLLEAGGKECILELHSMPRRSRGGAQFVVMGAFTEDVRLFKALCKLSVIGG